VMPLYVDASYVQLVAHEAGAVKMVESGTVVVVILMILVSQ
jgi:hypothetical protein